MFDDFGISDMKKHVYSISDGASNFGTAFSVYGQSSDVVSESGDSGFGRDSPIEDRRSPSPPPTIHLDRVISAADGVTKDNIQVLLEEDAAEDEDEEGEEEPEEEEEVEQGPEDDNCRDKEKAASSTEAERAGLAGPSPPSGQSSAPVAVVAPSTSSGAAPRKTKVTKQKKPKKPKKTQRAKTQLFVADSIDDVRSFLF